MIMMVVITMTMIMFYDGKQVGAEQLQWHKQEQFLLLSRNIVCLNMPTCFDHCCDSNLETLTAADISDPEDSIFSLNCLMLKVRAMHCFEMSVNTYQSKQSNISLQTCIFINTVTTPQILQVTLLILILYMLRTAPMQTFVLNECSATVVGWAAYQPNKTACNTDNL